MDWTAMNIHLFRIINDLGKEYTFLNPVMIFIAEYLILFLAATVILFWVSRGNRNRTMMNLWNTSYFPFCENPKNLIQKTIKSLYNTKGPP